MNITILIVDDEQEIRELLEIYLKNEGYSVLLAENGSRALEQLNSSEVSLIILDIMLPDINGINLCERIRENSDIPIIMLSAKGETKDRIHGIMTGADDYIAKPFNPLEVVVRIKALLKRCINKTDIVEEDIFRIDNLEINLNTHCVILDDKEVVLTNKEFEILKLLASNRGIVFSSRRIYEKVWGEDFFESDSTIMTHIKNLREKLGDSVKNPKFIKTIWGVGYKIEK